MIRTILIWLGVIVVVILVILWFITGGVGKTIQAAQGMKDSFLGIFSYGSSTTGGSFHLPWQPDNLMLAPQFTRPDEGSPGSFDGEESSKTLEEELSSSQEEYDALMKKIEDAKTFGEPSPYQGKIHIVAGGAAEGPVSAEYIEIEAAYDNTAPINLAGWSLQSALTGIRAHIPRGADLFLMGNVNPQKDIHLNAGSMSVISSASSPVGTSFRENSCAGYLSELQTFVPPLARNCPAPSQLFLLTPENLKTYGDACFDFVSTLPSCRFPRDVPENISPACRIFLANTFSYNGCVEKERYKGDFAHDSWRIYLNAGGELWRNSHDIIRLLDAEGKTADVVSY